MVTRIITALLLVSSCAVICVAAVPPALSSPADSAHSADSLPKADSLDSDTSSTQSDSSGWSDADSVRQAALKQLENELRQKRPEHKPVVRRERLSYYDSLVTYLLSPRQNQRESVRRSYYQDAGDYFKPDPGFFVLDHSLTPMRKTVQPFGLAGDRLGVVHNGYQFEPFEHIPEPDGLMDLNDIPTALDHDIYTLAGPTGLLFGGKSGVANLITNSKRMDDYSAESALLVDKGPLRYSFARGKYSKRFTTGRELALSLAYRKTDGYYYNHFEDSYDYYGEAYQPVGSQFGLFAQGHLYDRDGRLAIRPDTPAGSVQARGRFDRSLRLGLTRHNREHDARTEFGWAHRRQASYLTQDYVGSFNLNGHGGYISHERVSGRIMVRGRVDVDWLMYEYSPRNDKVERWTVSTRADLFTMTRPWSGAVMARQQWVEGFKFLPTAAAAIKYEAASLFFLTSVGYSERAPSLHELNLQFKVAPVYGFSSMVYADQGNPGLVSERQLTGTVEASVGPDRYGLSGRLTGGKIIDGIDWIRSDSSTALFMPRNGDVEFAGITGRGYLRLADFLRVNAGASYHHVKYERLEKRPYAPEYQAFSGMELHLFWRQKLIDLFGYAEAVYVGRYHGYDTYNLGNEVIVNAKLSFRMGKFRFHYIYHNLLASSFYTREQFITSGRLNTWGFTWDFLD